MGDTFIGEKIMSTINTLNTFSGAEYYQLSKQSNTGQASNSGLASILSGTTSGSAVPTSDNSAYTLNLSPAAQQYLAAQGSDSNQTQFLLTPKQQQKIDEILAKYKDAPFTQETFDKIQDDLSAAGLSSNTLAMLDKVKSFDATQVLIDALSGRDASVTDDTSKYTASDDVENTKSENYMQQIIKQWKDISTTASAGGGVSAVGGAGGA